MNSDFRVLGGGPLVFGVGFLLKAKLEQGSFATGVTKGWANSLGDPPAREGNMRSTAEHKLGDILWGAGSNAS